MTKRFDELYNDELDEIIERIDSLDQKLQFLLSSIPIISDTMMNSIYTTMFLATVTGNIINSMIIERDDNIEYSTEWLRLIEEIKSLVIQKFPEDERVKSAVSSVHSIIEGGIKNIMRE